MGLVSEFYDRPIDSHLQHNIAVIANTHEATTIYLFHFGGFKETLEIPSTFELCMPFQIDNVHLRYLFYYLNSQYYAV